MSINSIKPQSIVNHIPFEAVPTIAQEFFLDYSKRFIDPKKLSESVQFHGYYLTENHDPYYKIYVAHLTCLYDSDPEELLYVFEIDNDGAEIGHGEIRNTQSDNTYFYNKPFVGYTSTKENYYQQGYAKRRLQYMQELSKQFFHNNLYSDTVITEYAKKVWETLTQQGVAEKIKEGQNDRYRFTK